MLVKVRKGYGYLKGNKEFHPGAILDLTAEEIKKVSWKFEPAEPVKEAVPEEPKIEEVIVQEEPIMENRAVLDSTAGASILRRGRGKTAKK
jgi:hypothetical protein